MTASSWPEPVGAVEKYSFIDVTQDVRHGSLYQFVFISRYPQWPKFSIRFWNVCPSDRLRPVLKELHPLKQTRKVSSDIGVIFIFRDIIYPRCLTPILFLMLCLQRFSIDKPHDILPFEHCCSPHRIPALCVDMLIGLVCRTCVLLQKRPNCCPLRSARFCCQVSSLLWGNPTSDQPLGSLRRLNFNSPTTNEMGLVRPPRYACITLCARRAL